MSTRPFSCVLAVLTFMVAMAAAEALSLPRKLLGTWASDQSRCGGTGESTPLTIEPRLILAYEHAWTISQWTHRNGLWIGRGTAVDDQGSIPATVRLRIGLDGKLNFNNATYMRCPTGRRAGGWALQKYDELSAVGLSSGLPYERGKRRVRSHPATAPASMMIVGAQACARAFHIASYLIGPASQNANLASRYPTKAPASTPATSVNRGASRRCSAPLAGRVLLRR